MPNSSHSNVTHPCRGQTNGHRLVLALLISSPWLAQAWATGSAAGAFTSGRVVDGAGAPLAGAMVTLERNPASLGNLSGCAATTSVLTAPDGRWRLENPKPPCANHPWQSLRVTKPGFQPLSTALPAAANASAPAEVSEMVLTASNNVAATAPASAWLHQLPTDDRQARFTVGQCAGCHQLLNGQTRTFAASLATATAGQAAQSRAAAWRGMVQYMRNMTLYFAPGLAPRWGLSEGSEAFQRFTTAPFSLFDARDEAAAAHTLSHYLPAQFAHLPLSAWADATTPSALSAAGRIEEYALHTGGWTREVVTVPGQAGVWLVEDNADRIAHLVPGKTQALRWEPVAGTGQGPQGPHTINVDRQGAVWISLEESYALARLDPKTQQAGRWRVYPGFGAGAIAHDMCLDDERYVQPAADGHIWMTLIGENRLAELDPVTGAIRKYDMPARPGQQPFHAALYGCVIDAAHEMVWVTQLNGIVGGFNTRTKKLETVIDVPYGAIPHRLAIDDRDRLYVALSGDGQLLVYDTKKRRELPRLNLPDRNSAPYAATWDATRRVVWVAGSNSDAIYRIDPDDGSAAVIRLPSHNTYLRMIDIDRATGDLWSSYAPLPIGRFPNRALRIVVGDRAYWRQDRAAGHPGPSQITLNPRRNPNHAEY